MHSKQGIENKEVQIKYTSNFDQINGYNLLFIS